LFIEEVKDRRLVLREVGPNERRALDTLEQTLPQVVARGESPVLHKLFAEPLRAQDVDQAASKPYGRDEYGVSRAELERYHTMLGALARQKRAARTQQAWLFGAVATGMTVASVPAFALAANMSDPFYRTSQLAAAGGLLTAGALMAIPVPIFAAVRSADERAFDEISQLVLDSEAARSMALARITEQLLADARWRRRTAIVAAGLGFGVAALGALDSALLFSAAKSVANSQGNHGVIDSTTGMGLTMVGLSGALVVLAVQALASMPADVTSVEQLETVPPPKLRFDGISIGSNGKGVQGQAGFSF
jgi:hypothetical protein